MVSKNRSVKKANKFNEKVEFYLKQLQFWHGIFPDTGLHRNSQECMLACFNFVLHLRTRTLLEKKICRPDEGSYWCI